MNEKNFDRLISFVNSLGLRSDRDFLRENEEILPKEGCDGYTLEYYERGDTCCSNSFCWEINWWRGEVLSEPGEHMEEMQNKWKLLEKEIKRIVPDRKKVL